MGAELSASAENIDKNSTASDFQKLAGVAARWQKELNDQFESRVDSAMRSDSTLAAAIDKSVGKPLDLQTLGCSKSQMLVDGIAPDRVLLRTVDSLHRPLLQFLPTTEKL